VSGRRAVNRYVLIGSIGLIALVLALVWIWRTVAVLSLT
jgi:hypothetical protein